MSENHVQIRRGSGAPNNSALQPYELGFDHQNRILYINTDKLNYTLTDLTDTTWEINENLTLTTPTFSYSVNFTDKTNEAHTSLSLTSRQGYDYFWVKNLVNDLSNTEWYGQNQYSSSPPAFSQNSILGTWTFNDTVTFPSWLQTSPPSIDFYTGDAKWFPEYVKYYKSMQIKYYNNVIAFEYKYADDSGVDTAYSGSSGWATANQTITITGGTDLTNTTFTSWLRNNATQETAIFKISGGRGWNSFSQLISNINEKSLLTSDYYTIWQNGFWYYSPLNITGGDDATNGSLIDWLESNAMLRNDNATYYTLDYDSDIQYTYKNYIKEWSGNEPIVREKKRIITFTSGTDVTNSNLITWLQNNATLKSTPPQYENIKLLQYNSQDGSYLPLSAGSDNPLTNILYINLSNDGTQDQSTGIHIQHNGVNRGTLYQYCYADGSSSPDFLALAGRNKSGSQVNGIRFFDNGSVVLFGGTNTITLRPNGASSTSGQVNLATNGTLTVSGDIRRTAKTYSATQTASKSLSSGNTKICGITGIEAGIYLINAYVHMAMTGGGNAYINLYKATNNTSAICYDNHYVKAASSYFTTTTWATFAASGNLSLYIEVTASCSVDNVVLSMIRIA